MSSNANNYQACVDIGGTKVAVSLAGPQATQNLQLEARRAEPTAKEGANDALASQIIRMIEAARAELGGVAITGVGVSSCGPFVMRSGAVELAAPNICGGLAGPERGLPNTWMSAQLQAPLAARYGRVRVENDAVGALEAERRWGALRETPSCAYVTWSTGIGMGLCVDGHVLRGKNGNAGHAGHSFVSDGDALCGCGNTGDLEAMVAGNAIARRFASQGFADATQLFAAANQGNQEANAIVQELCRIMGRALYNLIVTLDLQRISLGGSVFWHNRELLLPRLRAEVAGKLPSMTAGVEIVPAGLGLQVGDYAALALVG
jgi:glucokinase